MTTPRTRIAILGGGIGALTTAYYLTSSPDWQDRFEVTLYQLGWRLGGKGANGRNAEAGQRIEEHGLHVWVGNYENAFATMRACYAELDRPQGVPLRSVDDAFTPRTHLTIFEQVGETWLPWAMSAPIRAGQPGTNVEMPTAWQVLVGVLEFVAWHADVLLDGIDGALHPAMELPAWVHTIVSRVVAALTWPARTAAHHAALLARHAGEDGQHDAAIADAVAHLIEAFRAHVRAVIWHAAQPHEVLRRACLCIDLGATIATGILRDRLLVTGLPSIDGEEFRGWLTRHGAATETVESSPVRALYDLCFAYKDGDLAQPDFAAGTALGIMLRVAFSYSGAVLYEMTAGMGEAVVAPIYEVLRARGVRFEFFHRVTAIEPSDDGTRVARIKMGRQVRLKAGVYDPLIDIGGVACWPDRPRYDQIQDDDRERLQRDNVNLESAWNGWQDVEDRVLEHGRDFDRVVLGISLGGLRAIAAPLAAISPSWRSLLDGVPCMQTQAVQLWLDRPLQELGWTGGVATTVAAPEPLDTWADMSHLLPREQWPRDQAPRSLQYLCGPLPGNFSSRPTTDRTTPADAVAAVRRTAIAWLGRQSGFLWPALSAPLSGVIDWQILHAAAGVAGEARLDAQYLHANIDPTELYVLSPAGGQQDRLAPDASGFENMVLAGDWTRTAINAGCVEAAVMSGMTASRALCGVPSVIAGERFMQG